MNRVEAIEVIKQLPIYRYEMLYDRESDLMKVLKMAIEDMEKQIPKKPISKESYFIGHLYCPNCDEFFDCDEEYYLKCGAWNYCGKCGQKIDWSDGREQSRKTQK